MRLNWANHRYLWQDGYGRFGRGFVRALLQAGHEVYPFIHDEMDMPGWFQQAKGLRFDRVTVQLCPPHNMRHLPGRSIGFSMHESMQLPMGWADHVNEKNQLLLVPSPWLTDLFQDDGVKIPIEVVPGGIDPDECPVLPQRRNQPYTFLCSADRGNRKGHDLVYSAFYNAFDFNNQDVRLIMKCRPGSLPGLDFSYSSDMRLTLWKEDVGSMADVFAQADVFVNPTRCEGYGMIPRESAACGLPTIVTNWSGTADNCADWAIPLNTYTLVESGMEGCGGKWAEPDMDELVEAMRWCYTHQDEAKTKGLEAAGWMRHHQTYRHAAARLVKVVTRFMGGILPEDTPSPVGAGHAAAVDATERVITAHGNGKAHEVVS